MEQDQDNSSRVASNAIVLGGKSWLAYLGVIIQAVLLLAAFTGFYYWQPLYWKPAAVVLVFFMLILAYRFALLRSYQLYYNDVGVWIYSGILPWKRGVTGVKWRDLDEAIFINSFGSWLTRSYTLRLTHRFTKASEILLSDMAQGKTLVQRINEQHQQYIRQSTSL